MNWLLSRHAMEGEVGKAGHERGMPIEVDEVDTGWRVNREALEASKAGRAQPHPIASRRRRPDRERLKSVAERNNIATENVPSQSKPLTQEPPSRLGVNPCLGHTVADELAVVEEQTLGGTTPATTDKG